MSDFSGFLQEEAAAAGKRSPAGLGGLWHGVAPALVLSIDDPDGMGRIKVELPWSPDPAGESYAVWARMATMFAGADRGSWFLPDVDDEVLVAFMFGDPERPFIIGGLWNGVDGPPKAANHSAENNIKLLRSRRGVMVTFDDTSGSEKLVLETPGGQKVTLSDGPGNIRLEDSNGNTVEMGPSGVSITASSLLKIEASAVTIDATAVSVNAATATFSGLVNAQTVVAPTISGATYTPGAGNIW